MGAKNATSTRSASGRRPWGKSLRKILPPRGSDQLRDILYKPQVGIAAVPLRQVLDFFSRKKREKKEVTISQGEVGGRYPKRCGG